MAKKKLSALLAGAAVVSGCAHVSVDKYSEMVAGVPYSLPQKKFTLSVEYELKGCDVKDGKPSIVIAKRPTLSATLEPDPAHHYYIPYASLRNPFKNIDLTVESYPNQTLKSINAAIEDKTGPAVTAAIGSALRIASLTGPTMLVEAAARPADARLDYCKPNALAALDEIKRIKAAAKKVSGDGAATRKKDSAPAGPAVAQEEPKDASDDADVVERLRQSLTQRYVVNWTPVRGASLASDVLNPTGLGTWLEQKGMDVVADKLKVSMRFDPSHAVPSDVDIGTITTPMDAVVMRQPMNGVLRVCEVSCPDAANAQVATSVLKEEAHAVPQLGHMFKMPLENRIFESQTLVLQLAEDGVVTKVGYKSNATVDAALGSVNTDLDAVLKAKAARDKAQSDAATAAQNAVKDDADRVGKENKAIADCLDAQAAVRKNGGTPSGVCQ